jgi:hypothetical protein
MAAAIERNNADIARYQATTAPTTNTASLIKNIEFQRDNTIEKRKEAAGTLQNLQRADTIASLVVAVLPKTSQTIDLLRRWMVDAAHLPGSRNDNDNGERMDTGLNPGDPEVQKRLRSDVDQVSASWILGTSLVFEVVILALAAWVFCRRDY